MRPDLATDAPPRVRQQHDLVQMHRHREVGISAAGPERHAQDLSVVVVADEADIVRDDGHPVHRVLLVSGVVFGVRLIRFQSRCLHEVRDGWGVVIFGSVWAARSRMPAALVAAFEIGGSQSIRSPSMK